MFTPGLADHGGVFGEGARESFHVPNVAQGMRKWFAFSRRIIDILANLLHRSMKIDKIDRKILNILQTDAATPLEAIARQVNLTPTPCWRRIQKLEQGGVILRRVALCSADKLGVGVTVFVALKTAQHNAAWFDKFARGVRDIPEIMEFYRMSGDVDYLMRVVVPDIGAYDAFYKKLISRIEIAKVSSAFAMEQIKYTTELPLEFARVKSERG